VQQARAFQLEEDGFKKFFGETLPRRQFRDEYWTAVGLLSEDEERLQAVFRLAGEHGHHCNPNV
jgi:hypothetical protein